MGNTINNIKDKYNEYLVLNMSKNIIKNSESLKKNIVLYSAVLSWLESTASNSDFINKYTYLKTLKELIEDTHLFEYVKNITKNINEDKIEKCIEIYKSIIKTDKYKILSEKAGYTLSADFQKNEKYLDNSLINKVIFFETFIEEIESTKQKMVADSCKVKR